MMRELLCAMALSASVTLHASAEPIKLGYLPLNNHTAFYAAELGLFKKHGVDVELVRFQAGPPMIQAMLSGAVPAGDIGVVPMIRMAAQKLPVCFLTSDGIDTPKHPAAAIMVRPDDAEITTFADLKEKRVGQVALGTVTYMRMMTAAKKYGLAADAVKQTFVLFPNMGTVLASRQVDAIYTWPPFDTMIEAAGQGRVLMNDTDWSPYSAASGKSPTTLVRSRDDEQGVFVSLNISFLRFFEIRFLQSCLNLLLQRRIIGDNPKFIVLILSEAISGSYA